MAVYNLNDFSFVKYIQLSSTLDQVQGGKIFVTNNPLNSSNPLDENVTLSHYDAVAAVPEPASCALILGGLALVGFVGKRHRHE